MTDWTQVFIEKTKEHIQRVNFYAQKLGYSFPYHDRDKFFGLIEGYKYLYKPKQDRTVQEQEALDNATFIHITSQKHHPEFWTTSNLKGFTRNNSNPNGIIEATKMQKLALIEMVCDWKAVSDTKDNTCLEWFQRVNGIRWYFTEEQQNFILEIIENLEK